MFLALFSLVGYQRNPVWWPEPEYVYHWHDHVIIWLSSWPFEAHEMTQNRSFIRLGGFAVWIYAAVITVRGGIGTIGVLRKPDAPWYAPTSAAKKIPTPKKPSLVDELERLADLRNRGYLSQEEFEQQKTKLLESE
jgi:hypothetical protein